MRSAIIPKPGTIRTFRTAAAFENWLRRHHDTATEVWLRIYKKGSGAPSITLAQALDLALCWGWIDGIRKSYDEQSYLQRYSPRRPKSVWSQINRDHVARLTAAGRMTPHGQRHVDAAKADGRWEAPTHRFARRRARRSRRTCTRRSRRVRARNGRLRGWDARTSLRSRSARTP